ncbi:lysozyme inhibitor LprI family protein [Roseibacillus ishigakijimensis]|uniref:DUF1311 domain-containing protein n=1 Tax=Roseibacillus ishigakijimensis TaxID=454146 RepID=A0A934VKE5_9BACT|nr:lysozyme inhibitor LprI family protein [Roseibacillus ishigakijimensis]MBK1833569.1 DUF1311 domain-containing protein [Roseibacillus ishigakijimensis]
MKILFALVLMVFSPFLWADAGKALAEFEKADAELNRVYQEVKEGLSESLFSVVQADQRQWVDYRIGLSEWQAAADGKNREAEYDLAGSLTKERIKWLRAWLQAGEAPEFEGLYSDGYGGELGIVKTEAGYQMRLSVVRGPTFHVGYLSGALKVNGSTAWFEVDNGEGERPTWLTLLWQDDGTPRIRLLGENTWYHHGARAYFDGRYLWMRALSTEEKAEVLKGEE